MVRQGKEAVEEWGRYFERVLNEGGSTKVQGGREVVVNENGLFSCEVELPCCGRGAAHPLAR